MDKDKSSQLGKRFPVFALALMLAALGFALLASCSSETQAKQSESRSYQLAGDSTLPELDGDYSYVLARVTAKNQENNSLEVEVVAWESEPAFKKSVVAAGETGIVSCSELTIYPAGVQIGSIVVISCLDSEADVFPITAYSIEALDLFEERVARWLNA